MQISLDTLWASGKGARRRRETDRLGHFENLAVGKWAPGSGIVSKSHEQSPVASLIARRLDPNLFLVFGAAWLVGLVAFRVQTLHQRFTDFSVFYASLRAIMSAEPMYEYLNYNPPHFHLLIFPLAFLSLEAAYLVFSAVSAALLIWTLRRIGGQLPAHEHRRLWILAIGLAGTGAAFMQGQVTWFVAAALTEAWIAARDQRIRRAGLWLGCAVSLKPFLGLLCIGFLLRRQWRMVLWASAGLSAAYLLGIAVFGPQAFADWIAILRRPLPQPYSDHVAVFANASIVGALIRAGTSLRVALAAAVVVGVLTVLAARSAEEDESWLMLTSGAILASPLGWIYYVPLLVGPAAICLPRLPRALTIAILAIALVPFALPIPFTRFPATLGNLYAVGLLALWASFALRSLARTAMIRGWKSRGLWAANPKLSGYGKSIG